MVETVEPNTEAMSCIEQLRHCADWLEAHGFDGTNCGVWPTRCGQPLVHLVSVDQMKRLFPSVTPTRKRESSRYIYTLTADGIRFIASQPIDTTPSSEPEEVTL